MSWFYLALLAPLLFAIVVLIDDSLLQFVYKSPYVATIISGLFGALPLLAVLFKTPVIPLDLALLSLTAGFLTVAYYFYYFKGLSSDSPSVVIALFSLAPASIPIFAHFLINERLAPLQIIGFSIVLLASLGMAVVDIKKFKFSKALLPMVIAVIFVDAVSIITKHVYQEAEFFPAYMYFCGGMGLGGLYFLLIRFAENTRNLIQIGKGLKRLAPILIVAELINIAAEFTLNLAIANGPVSLVKVIEGVQPMYILLIAVLLFPFAPQYFREAGEGGLIKKFSFMVVGVVGLAAIAMA